MLKRSIVIAAVAALLAAFLLFSGGDGSQATQARQQGTLHDCPQPGKWAISVWAGEDGIETGQALATCGENVVAFAYYIEPETQLWSHYFVNVPGLRNTLLTLDDNQGIITHGY